MLYDDLINSIMFYIKGMCYAFPVLSSGTGKVQSVDWLYGRSVKLHTELILMLRKRMRVAFPPLHPYAFIQRCLSAGTHFSFAFNFYSNVI
jgi:hypothetical protein